MATLWRLDSLRAECNSVATATHCKKACQVLWPLCLSSFIILGDTSQRRWPKRGEKAVAGGEVAVSIDADDDQPFRWQITQVSHQYTEAMRCIVRRGARQWTALFAPAIGGVAIYCAKKWLYKRGRQRDWSLILGQAYVCRRGHITMSTRQTNRYIII